MKKITPFLWFDDNAGEAIELYTSIFKNSKTINVHRYGKTGPGPEGTIMTGTIELEGQQLMLLNAGPMYSFNPSFSLYVNCENQEEVDYYWNRFIESGGTESRCGWLEDKFGVSWQIIPSVLGELLGDPDPGRAGRAMKAMMQMVKLDVAALKAAADGK